MAKQPNTSPSRGRFLEQLRVKSRKRRAAIKVDAAHSMPRVRRNDLLPPLVLVQRAIPSLRYPERNVRVSETTHIRELAKAIGALGFCQPILIDQDDQVIDGMERLKAAALLGMTDVPCICVGHLTPGEIRVLRIASNRLGEKGGWDLDVLKAEVEVLLVEECSIEVAGFDPDEIDQICLDDGSDTIETGDLEPEADASAASRIGDCFELGAHRLVCGDATDQSVLQRLLEGDVEVRMVLTDEPYNVPIAGHVSSSGHREFAMASGEMSAETFLAFNTNWMTHAAAHLCDGGILATFCDWRAWPTVTAAASALGLAPLNLVVWTKTNAGMGSLYRSQHELLPLFKKGTAPHVNNVELGAKGRWRSNVWTYPGASSLGSDARRGSKDHPTVKPVAMIADALLDLTRRGDLVLDPFLGSGTSLLAAEQTGRVCRGIELDPLYVDVIVRRYQAATGKTVTLIGSGITFDALAAQRSAGSAAGE